MKIAELLLSKLRSKRKDWNKKNYVSIPFSSFCFNSSTIVCGFTLNFVIKKREALTYMNLLRDFCLKTFAPASFTWEVLNKLASAYEHSLSIFDRESQSRSLKLKFVLSLDNKFDNF